MAETVLQPVAGDPWNGGAIDTVPVAGDPFAGRAIDIPGQVDDFGRDLTIHAQQPQPAAQPAPQQGMGWWDATKQEARNMGQGFFDALTLPGDVYAGRSDPLSDEGIARAFNLAGMMAGNGHLSPSSEREILASRSSSLYNPPSKPPRAFAEDYPNGAPADASGKLTQDIDGRPLGARFIAGRAHPGGPDNSLGAGDVTRVGQGIGGSYLGGVPPATIGGDAGRLVLGRVPETGAPQGRIAISNQLSPEKQALVSNHETGHLIDEIAGQIPTDGLHVELKTVYNDLNNPQSHGRPFTPQNNGYKGDDVPREHMAEAVRAYMTDPNYLKSVAPNTAARIRAAVNSNPRLSDTIQFNASGVPLPPSDHRHGYTYGDATQSQLAQQLPSLSLFDMLLSSGRGA